MYTFYFENGAWASQFIPFDVFDRDMFCYVAGVPPVAFLSLPLPDP